MFPSASVDPDASRSTVSGASPAVGDMRKLATGGELSNAQPTSSNARLIITPATTLLLPSTFLVFPLINPVTSYKYVDSSFPAFNAEFINHRTTASLWTPVGYQVLATFTHTWYR